MADERDEAQETEAPAEEVPPKKESELREIPEEQLQKTLAEHRTWVESNHTTGRQAALRRANLTGRNLRGALLQNAKLDGSRFNGADLTGADLSGANLQEADLQEARLDGANLSQVNLHKAILRGVNFKGLNMQGGNLTLAMLDGANLQEAQLIGANLQGNKLHGTDLQRADLERANLQGVEFQGANLQGANLKRANFQQANLHGLDLMGFDLHGADFRGANLLKAKLQDANLQDADLTDAKGLSGEQLARANVSGAKLPEDIKEFKGLETTEEASRNARKIFLSMLLGCVYAWLTIATTSDARLLTNSATSPLPIIRTTIPIVGFYLAAPLLLLGLYTYFHLYMQRLWEGLSTLPAVFPDGTPLDKKAYPWLLNGLVRSHFTLLRSDRPLLSRLQSFVSAILAWVVVPITLLLFWGRYIPRHEWFVTIIQIIVLMVSLGFGTLTYLHARSTLRGQPVKRYTHGAWAHVVAVGLGAFLYFFSFGAINGVPPHYYSPDSIISAPNLKAADVRRWVPLTFEMVGWRTYADLAEEDVSTKPPNWTGQKEEEISLVKGARLEGKDLRYVNASGAFLIGADLDKVNLQSAVLVGADLRGAHLKRAKLQLAHLYGAKLQKANLSLAKLWGANLRLANLRGARLMDAQLQGAVLSDADLQEASFFNANLTEADLKGADLKKAILIRAKGLNPSQVKAARNWELAYYDDAFLKKYGKELGLPQSMKEHVGMVNKKLAELEAKEKAAGGKK